MKRYRWVLLIVLVLVLAAVREYFEASYRDAYGADTCGASTEALEEFLEKRYSQEVTLLKTAQEGRTKAVLYERAEFGDCCVAIFQSCLFGQRWKYDGMDQFHTAERLYMTGSWTRSGMDGSDCEVVVYGDNRGGTVGAYESADAPGVGRETLESDYILDIYILDGIGRLPRSLSQFDRDGQELEYA